MPRKLQGIDYIQATEPDLLFSQRIVYTETISSAAQTPCIFHQAIATTCAGPGVAHLTLPQDILAANVYGEVPSVGHSQARSELSASERDVAEIARRIDKAERVVIMCGAGYRDAADESRRLSGSLKAH